MSTAAKLLILENRLGQKVRSFAVSSKSLNIVYLTDSRRIEAIADLTALDDNEIDYQLIKTIDLSEVTANGVALRGLGRIKMASASEDKNSPIYTLPEEDDNNKFILLIKRSSIAHVAAVVLLLAASWIVNTYFNKTIEPQLVTIALPQPEPKVEKVAKKPRATVKVSEKKIQPTKKKYSAQAPKPVVKTKKYQTNTVKAKDVTRMGALAALGGTAKGTKGYEGLDNNSMKAIRSAGQGRGGGGVGATGKGGMKGYLPGKGLIAGSAGSGGKASSAGGYGTQGAGGGRAGYGKISLVGGTSAVSLPIDDEATVQGGLDRDQIIAVINKNKGQIIYCYEKGLQSQPNIGGRVAVDFVIGPAGRITTAKVARSSLGSKTVEGCMLQKMKAWQFPRPVGNVNVDVLYPFELMRVSSR